MYKMSAYLLSLLFFSFASANISRGYHPFVQTSYGGIVGTVQESSGHKVEAYEGIPYALPPTGNRRFQPPQPAEKWTGNLTANKPKSPCVQRLESKISGAEDCLYLNVYVPAKAKSSRPAPVLFSIHGGAYQFGKADVDTEILLEKNIIHVNLNYRLGPFGFLSTEDEVVPGNMGLKDQSLALRWVSENIHHFGGDPRRITLIGLSAGGASVHFHYLSPMSKGLFRNGISFSGTTFMPWTHAENARTKALKLAVLMGCSTKSVSEAIECLRSKPSHGILEATKHFMPWQYNPFTPFGPVVEKGSAKPFIDRSPAEIISSGDAADVPWITGVTSEEGIYPAAEYVNDKDILNTLDKNWDSIAPHLLDFNYTIPSSKHVEVARKIRNHYFGTKPINRSTAKELISMVSDRLFVLDAEKAARAQAKANKSPVMFWYYSYRALFSNSHFLSKSIYNFGVSHGDDYNMVFKSLFDDSPFQSPRDREMQKKMIDLVVSMAEKGYPSFGFPFEWKKVDPSKKEFDVLHMYNPDNIKMESKPDLGHKQFWSTIDFDENKVKH